MDSQDLLLQGRKVSLIDVLQVDIADSTVEDSKSRIERSEEITNMMHYALPICTLQSLQLWN